MIAVSDGIRWHPRVRVLKWSEDQVSWVRRRTGIMEPAGRLLALMCPEPEDGIAEAAGNLLVTVGLNQLTNLIIGGGSNAFTHANAIMGIGTGSTAAAVGNTALTNDNTANAWYQQADASYPQQANGVLTCYSTFTTSNANFAWNEWCFAFGGGGTITAGIRLSLVTSTAPTMMNHAVPGSSLGTKASGSWQLQATITLS